MDQVVTRQREANRKHGLMLYGCFFARLLFRSGRREGSTFPFPRLAPAGVKLQIYGNLQD